jgi:hypothetical protein
MVEAPVHKSEKQGKRTLDNETRGHKLSIKKCIKRPGICPLTMPTLGFLSVAQDNSKSS